MLAELWISTGPDAGRRFTLEDGQTLQIGRGQDSHTQLTDPHTSRKHCQVEVDGGNFFVADIGSAGGTFVNGQRITRQQLQPGDVIRIGNTELRLKLDSELVKPTESPGMSALLRVRPRSEAIFCGLTL